MVKTMSKIAFLGMGAMGTRMAAKLVSAGHELSIWNRTDKVYEGVLNQAKKSLTIAEAVSGAEYVFSMVRDDEASLQIWLDNDDGALAHMEDGSIGIECSTLSLPAISELSSKFKAQNKLFFDAPLAGSRPQAEAGALIFFIGGDKETLSELLPLFNEMGAKAQHIGENGAGMAIKLAVNALFGAQLALTAELMGFLNKCGLNLANTIEVIANTPVCSPAVKIAAGAMAENQHSPNFPIDLVAKDFQLIDLSSTDKNAATPICKATQQIFAEAVGAGLGPQNITGIAQLYI